MGKNFNVEFRKNCKVCGKLITNKRSRTYCSKECRNKNFAGKYKEYRAAFQQAQQDKIASKYDPNKIQCPLCGRYYVQLCTHVLQRHEMTARQFKKEFGYDVKRGLIPEWYREVKAEICIENGTTLKGEEGKEFWFVPGDKRAGKYERSEQTLQRLKNLHKKT